MSLEELKKRLQIWSNIREAHPDSNDYKMGENEICLVLELIEIIQGIDNEVDLSLLHKYGDRIEKLLNQ